MNSASLWEEMFAAARNLRPDHLHNLGIDTDRAVAAGGLGVDRIVVSDNFYEPCESGFSAAILPVYWADMPAEGAPVPDEDLIDMVAFRPGEPERFWLRTGLGEFLNAAALDGLYLSAPLRVYRDPLRWLREGAQGCVPIDRRTAPVRLSCVPVIVADDEAHAFDIEHLIRWPIVMPDIRFIDPALQGVAA